MSAAIHSRRIPGSFAILVLALLALLAAVAASTALAEDASTPEASASGPAPVALAFASDSTSAPSSSPSSSVGVTEETSHAGGSGGSSGSLMPAASDSTTSAPAAASAPEKSAAAPTTGTPAPAKSIAKPAPSKSAAPRKLKSPPPVMAVPRNSSSSAAPPLLVGNDRIDERARVEREFARTASVLKSVDSKVRRSFNKKAREDFDRALSLQKDSRDALDQNLFARSDRLTQESRALARQIAIHLGPPQDDPDYVGMAIDRTDDAIGRAKEVLKDAGGAPERRRLDKLQDMQASARRLLKSGTTRDAYALTREARDGVLTLLRDCDNLPVGVDTAERALKRADRALAQVNSELGERPTTTADRYAKSARDQMSKARSAFAKKNYRDTLIYSKLAERDLELAVNAQRALTSRSG